MIYDLTIGFPMSNFIDWSGLATYCELRYELSQSSFGPGQKWTRVKLESDICELNGLSTAELESDMWA